MLIGLSVGKFVFVSWVQWIRLSGRWWWRWWISRIVWCSNENVNLSYSLLLSSLFSRAFRKLDKRGRKQRERERREKNKDDDEHDCWSLCGCALAWLVVCVAVAVALTVAAALAEQHSPGASEPAFSTLSLLFCSVRLAAAAVCSKVNKQKHTQLATKAHDKSTKAQQDSTQTHLG